MRLNYASFSLSHWYDQMIFYAQSLLMLKWNDVLYIFIIYEYLFLKFYNSFEYVLAQDKTTSFCYLGCCYWCSLLCKRENHFFGLFVQFLKNQFGLIWSKLNPWVELYFGLYSWLCKSRLVFLALFFGCDQLI